MNRLLLTCVVGLVTSPALAETDSDALTARWAAGNQVYVTKKAREAAFSKALAEDAKLRNVSPVVAALPAPQEVQAQREPVARPMTDQERAAVEKARAAANAREEEERRERMAPTFNTWLVRFPTIRLIVQPAPPRDYRVAINGEDCPATERGLYKVPAGPVMVRVVRTGKPPCVWNGNLEEGRTQEVPCNF
jgi:hypothetical protein